MESLSNRYTKQDLIELAKTVARIRQEMFEMDENSKEAYLISRGREECLKEGREEVTAERNREIALEMLRDGYFQMNAIIKYSRLSLSEIKKIAEDNGITLAI